MVKFKAKIWKTGNSFVVTVPSQLIGAEVNNGEDVVMDMSGNPPSQI